MKKYLYFLLLAFTIITGFYFVLGWAQLPAGHRYIYILDDVYIHMALARNFAELGVWSVNTSGFDSASSSILYTLLLSCLIKVFGDWEYYPLLLNVLFGYLTIFAVYRYFRDFGKLRDLPWVLWLLLPFSLLYMMALIGMEHTIHMFLIVQALYYIQAGVQNEFKGKNLFFILFITFLLSLVRFESMFFTAALAFALFLRKDFLPAFAVLVAGFISILTFGLISVDQGGYFFPNSVMVKGNYPEADHFLLSAWRIFSEGILFNTSFYKCLFFPFLILTIHLLQKYRGDSWKHLLRNETAIIVVITVGVLQSLFAFMKYRYENYIMIAVLLLVIPVISKAFNNVKKTRWTISKTLTIGSTAALVLISIYRFGYHHQPLQFSSKGINEQQVEMSRFLYRYYKGEKVLANDIGAISYFSHVQLLDMVGLGSTDIASMKVANKHKSRQEYISENKKFIRRYVAKENCRVAVIYPEWFPGGPPAEWIPVASWRSRGAYGPAIERIVFYAISPAEVQTLQRHLSAFDLDPNVEQWFYEVK